MATTQTTLTTTPTDLSVADDTTHVVQPTDGSAHVAVDTSAPDAGEVIAGGEVRDVYVPSGESLYAWRAHGSRASLTVL